MSEPVKARKAPPSDTFRRTASRVAGVADALTPWLLDFGNWIFSGLVAFDLVVLGATLTIGPVDLAVEIATAAMALALPLDVAGFLLLRLGADLRKVHLGQVETSAFVEAGFKVDRGPDGDRRVRGQRAVIFRYSYAMLLGTSVLTVAGLAAALWHVAWWATAAFLGMVAASAVVIVLALLALSPPGRWTTAAGEAEPEKKSDPSSS